MYAPVDPVPPRVQERAQLRPRPWRASTVLRWRTPWPSSSRTSSGPHRQLGR
jgi:hypothetical protein